jgi:hypothetical protein
MCSRRRTIMKTEIRASSVRAQPLAKNHGGAGRWRFQPAFGHPPQPALHAASWPVTGLPALRQARTEPMKPKLPKHVAAGQATSSSGAARNVLPVQPVGGGSQ